MTMENDCDIIIIGAGIAGVSCVYHLIVDLNYKGKVILLEARDRLGGRIAGDTIAGGVNIELGANWIHGIINNPVYNLAARYNLIDPLDINGLISKDEFNRMAGLTSAGDPVPYKTIVSVYKIYFSMLKQCENFYLGMRKGNVFQDQSNDAVGQWLRTEIDKYLATLGENNDRTLIATIFNNFLARETVISGCHSMDQVSLPYFGAYEELPGGNVTIPEGYTNLINCLLEEVRFKLKQNSRSSNFQLILEQPVTQIRWPGIGTQGSDEFAQVTTSQGTTYRCRHVVTTIPLGVLKTCHSQLFEPPLPTYKIECIERMGFGTVNKIWLEFKDQLSPKFIDSSLIEILTFWLPQDLETVGWASKIYSMAKIGERCLLVWLSGAEACKVEQMDIDEVQKHLISVIRKVLKAPDLPDPIHMIMTRWNQDPYSQGSYSYISNVSSVGDIEKLAQPIYSNPGQEKPNLIFAGEACHPSFFSTTHGAFLTGRKAALYLVDSDETNGSDSNNLSVKDIDPAKKLSNL